MNRDLFLAILALDSYNRGYGKRLAFVGSQTGRDTGEVGRQLGTATILKQDISDEAFDADFYAIAYNWNGETVISYRGTDNLLRDAVTGYGVGAGIAGVPQGNLAIEFYSAVTGRAAFGLDGSANVVSRGDSRGGGTVSH